MSGEQPKRRVTVWPTASSSAIMFEVLPTGEREYIRHDGCKDPNPPTQYPIGLAENAARELEKSGWQIEPWPENGAFDPQ
jgi:hypothetical protein